MKLFQVIHCSNPVFWYTDLVNQTLIAKSNDDYYYYLFHPELNTTVSIPEYDTQPAETAVSRSPIPGNINAMALFASQNVFAATFAIRRSWRGNWREWCERDAFLQVQWMAHQIVDGEIVESSCALLRWPEAHALHLNGMIVDGAVSGLWRIRLDGFYYLSPVAEKTKEPAN